MRVGVLGVGFLGEELLGLMSASLKGSLLLLLSRLTCGAAPVCQSQLFGLARKQSVDRPLLPQANGWEGQFGV